MSEQAVAKTPGFGTTFASEWFKLFSTRAPRRNLALAVLLGLAMSTLLTVTTRLTFDGWPPEQQATFDPVLYPLSGSILVSIFFIAFGVNAVAPEYSSGMIRQTFTTTPHRGRVIAAKMLAVAIAISIAGTLTTLAMHGVSHLILASTPLQSADWSSWELWRTVVASATVGVLMPMLAVAFGFIIRSAAGTISFMLFLIFGPMILGALLPKWIRENVLAYLPSNAGDSLTVGHLQESDAYAAAWPAAVACVVWAVVMFVVTRMLINRRDV